MAMPATKLWTLEQVDALPDDGNKYELVHGELIVTPAPGPRHEDAASRLNELFVPYVSANALGRVYLPHSVVQHDGSQVEPDLMVRRPLDLDAPWDQQPVPLLAVEVLSPSNRASHRSKKRAFYLEVGVTEYWVIDPVRRTVTVSRHGQPDVVFSDTVTWHPAGARVPLVFEISEVIG